VGIKGVAARGDQRGGGWWRKEIGGVASCTTGVVVVETGWRSRKISAEVVDTVSGKSD
jgi:hypothetical protein